MSRLTLILMMLSFPLKAAYYTLPSERTITWLGNVGLRDGIPSSMTEYTNMAMVGINSNGTVDVSSEIQTEMNKASSNEYVYLPEGQYRIDTRLKFNNNYTELRGDGIDKTVILGNINAGPAVHMRWDSTAVNHTNITANVEKGATNLVIGFHTNNIAPGYKLRIGYFNNPQPLVWDKDTTNQALNFDCYILGTNGTDVHIDPPAPFSITTDNALWQSHVGTYSVQPGIQTGMTSLYLTNMAGNTGLTTGIDVFNSYEAYFDNVKISSIDGSAGHIFIVNSIRTEVAHCWMDGRTPDGDDVDGVDVKRGTGVLVYDSIFDGLWASIHFGEDGAALGCAALYNYIVNPWTTIGADQIASSISSHGGHSAYNLVEGNQAEGFPQMDGFHANVSHWTFYRNHFMGISSEPGATNRQWAIALNRYSYTNSIINNVLGVTNLDWHITVTNSGFSQATSNYIYVLGYPNIGNQSYTGTRPPNSWTDTAALDYDVTNTVILHGNFDYANVDVVYEGGESQTFADSWYYTEKPSWFSNAAYPPIGGDLSPLVTDIPAKLRYNGTDYSNTNNIINLISGNATISGNVVIQ